VPTLSWLALLGAAAVVVRRGLRDVSLAVFIAVGLALAWLHVHTSPLLPAPRAVATLATGLALALVLRGRGEPWAHACAVVAAASHPYNHAVELCIAVGFVVAIAGTPATALLRPAMAARVVATGALATAASLLLVRAANPAGGVSLAELFGQGKGLPLANWAANHAAAGWVALGVGGPLVVLVHRQAGARRAAAVGALLLASVGLPAVLSPAGFYPGEISHRVGGAWVAALFALALREDWATDLARLPPRARIVAVLAVVLAAAAGAAPELVGIRTAPHYAPWLHPPRVETMPGVERECLAIIARAPR
jgi:hypothetical protein